MLERSEIRYQPDFRPDPVVRRRRAERRRRRQRQRMVVLLLVTALTVGLIGGAGAYVHSCMERARIQQQAELEAEQERIRQEQLRAQREAEQRLEQQRRQEEAAKNVSYPEGEPKEGEKVVYLTIDDGPSKYTGEILDILDEYHAQATWFVTAQFMSEEQLKTALREIMDRGHRVGVHSYSHDYRKIYASPDDFLADYSKMEKLVWAAADGDPLGDTRLMRFPGGSNAGYNREIREELLKAARERGLIYYDWNSFVGDTEGLTAEQMVEKTLKECRNRSKVILLLHDTPDKGETVKALPGILSSLQRQGYEFRRLDAGVRPIQFA